MYVKKIIAVTNRTLAPNSYWDQVDKIVEAGVDTLILREKDLTEDEYTIYARQALQICNAHQATCILHHYGKAAIKLHVPRFHCSLEYLKSHSSICYFMTTIGVSIHTATEAKEAEELGATYLIAGHVFDTACKPDLPPIGITELENICQAVTIPVYALGGVTPQTAPALKDIPISGIASMSGLMTSTDAPAYVQALKNSQQ